MTDPVIKNLEVEKMVPKFIEHDHVPDLFFEWKPHCPKIRQIKFVSIVEIREKRELREKFKSIIPALKPFFLDREAIVKVDIATVLKLVIYDKSTNSSPVTCWVWLCCCWTREESQAHVPVLFEKTCKTPLGAASILLAVLLLQMILDETEKVTLLVQFCQICVNCEFLLTELYVLAYFNYKVTSSLSIELNFVIKKLLKIIPSIYKDLRKGNLEILRDYLVI